MKQKISKLVYAQARRRIFIEITGLIILVIFVYYQWDVVLHGMEAIRNSDLLFLSMAVAVFWLILPVTVISYQLLSDKKIPLFDATIANLAGSGPGRIVPGGLGRIGIMAIYLKKIGINLQKAIVISVTNNVFGVIVNSSILFVVLALEPTVRNSIVDNFDIKSLASGLLILITFVAILLWLLHLRAMRKAVKNLHKQWIKIRNLVLRHPSRLIGLLLTSLIILLGNLLIIQLSSVALGEYFTPGDLFIALSIGVAIGGLIPTPGGVGGVEAGIAATLTLLGYGATESTGVALLYRAITYWQPLIPGTIGYFYLKEKKLL